jgi:hypothetical protein
MAISSLDVRIRLFATVLRENLPTDCDNFLFSDLIFFSNFCLKKRKAKELAFDNKLTLYICNYQH